MPKFSGEGRLGLLVEIAVIVLDRLHVTAGYIIWPLFVFGALLIADWIWRGEWQEKQTNEVVKKKRAIFSALSSIFLLTLGFWLFHRIGYIEKHPGLEIATNPPDTKPVAKGEPEKPKNNDRQVPPETPPPKKPKKTPLTSVPAQQQSGKDNAQTGPITTGPCSNVFNGGSGNQGTTNCGDVPPQIIVTKQKENVPDNGIFTTEFKLDITASKAFLLHVKASAPNLVADFPLKIDDVRPPEQGGMSFSATSKYGVGFIEVDYGNIESGSYIVTVQTSKPNTVRLDCR